MTDHFDGAKVFVVDDDAGMRNSMRRLIASVGLHVETFRSAQEFLDSYDPAVPGCAVLDVRMPEMSGLEVCQALKTVENAATVPIILVTAKDDLDTRASGMRLGVSDFLTKPVNMQELHIRVRNQLHVREIRRQLDDTSRKIDSLGSDEAAE